MKKVLVLAALAALLALPAFAQTIVTPPAPGTLPDEPIVSIKRLSLGIGANYAWWSGESNNLPVFDKEWQAGFYGAYALTPHAALIGKTEYGLDSKVFNSAFGIRLTVFKGN